MQGAAIAGAGGIDFAPAQRLKRDPRVDDLNVVSLGAMIGGWMSLIKSQSVTGWTML